MPDFLTSETFETVMGGVVVLGVLALAIKIGPLRIIGELLAHLAFKILFIAFAIGVVFVFVQTDLGEALGGVNTGLIVVFASPLIFLVIIGLNAWMKRKAEAGAEDDDDR